MQDVKEKAALSSIAASAALTIAKAAVGLVSGSLAILSEAGHSLVDLGATTMTYFAVRISGKPADAEHHYGHGKIESLAALAETALLFLLSGIVIWEAVQRLWWHEAGHVEATFWAFGVMIASVIIDFFRARVLSRVARETGSEALEADALHFSSDMWSSLAVLIGLVAVAYGYSWADAAAAIVVAVFICIAGWRLGRRTIDTLTDVAPPGAAERISRIALRARRVVDVERVRVRAVGKTLFVDLVLAVSRTLPVDQAEAVKDDVARALAAEMPEVEAIITTVPRALDDETVLERVTVIARNLALAVHHITVHSVGERLAISLDLEVDGDLSLGTAHEIASRLEAAVEDELGPEVEVETHLEPLQASDLPGRDAAPPRVEAIRAALVALAAELGPIRDVHDVRVRDTDDGEIVNFHCHVDPALTVRTVHEKVDDVERALRRRWPSITRVIGHAEPPGHPAATAAFVARL
jgi:cation diffusion facilitator family transporter